jgi:hypothetical protein
MVVIATFPIYPVLSGKQFIHFANPYAFYARIIQCESGLVKKTVGSCASRLPGCIEPDTSFTNPDKETADTRSQHNGCMGYPDPRFKHEAGYTTHRDMCADTIFIYQHKGPVQHIQISFFQKESR